MLKKKTSHLIGSESIILDAESDTWEEAVDITTNALVDGGIATPAYKEEVYNNIKMFSSYAVIANNIALIHARPSENVLHTGISFVRLLHPIRFTLSHSEPVNIIIGVAATDTNAHLNLLASVATVLADSSKIDKLQSAQSKEEIVEILS
jgi:PTS system ascorbate-specific IIA component